ncbi:MAG: M16 family metallopeptidase [Gemmatimonadaceae bacterium]
MKTLCAAAAALVALAVPPRNAFAQSPSGTPTNPKPALVAVKRSASSDVLPFKASETTLPNGLKIIVVPTGFPNIVSIQIPVQAGSRNEVEAGKTGFAHFFEHIMFRGTKAYPPERFNAVMNHAGARHNASTSDDKTWYYATFAKEDLEPIIEMIGDQFQNLDYSEADFKTEARAVLGEYNKNAANPFFKVYETLRRTAYNTHTYGHTTMGFINDIENMPSQYAYSKQFFERYYRPERTTIIVAGDVDSAQVVPLVAKYWGNWKKGNYTSTVPQEPKAAATKYAHVDWPTPTSPIIAVAFRNPAFSETNPDNAAMDMVSDIWFGETSDIYKKLVVNEQKVDALSANNTSNRDPELFTVYARLKDPTDAPYVRDEILRTVARARSELIPAGQLADAKSALRYGFIRTLDNTNSIASTLAQYVHFRRSYSTLNNAYRLYETLTPSAIRTTAARYFTDQNEIVVSLSNGALPAAIATQPKLATLAPAVRAAKGASPADAERAALKAKVDSVINAAMGTPPAAMYDFDITLQKSPLPEVEMKLAFTNAGSAYDPPGKEGLAALSAAMIAEAGSQQFTTNEITAALYPVAGSFSDQPDKELTTFTGKIHRDNWHNFLHLVLGQLVTPGFRDDDFKRLKEAQLTALTQDLRSNNEEELGKEQLQADIFAGAAYAHPALGTVAGINAITIDDVRRFAAEHYTRGNLMIGLNGDVPDGFQDVMRAILGGLPASGAPGTRAAVTGPRPVGLNVDIIRKDTRSTAISFGLPISVTRSSPDFAALSVARSWLGEHRQGGRLYDRIREIRGMNYGDYSYIEAFPRGMFQFFPDANTPRSAQIFEVWIRPVVPTNAHMALRIATAELQQLIDSGMTQADFENTRDYLMKNVYIMTQTQDQQLGYALDSKWYGIPEFTSYMRGALGRLTLVDVNAAIRKQLSATDLDVVVITKDADALRDALVSDAFSPIKYDGEKPASLLEEDKVIGARKLGISADRVKITDVDAVFAH